MYKKRNKAVPPVKINKPVVDFQVGNASLKMVVVRLEGGGQSGQAANLQRTGQIQESVTRFR